MKAPQKSNMQLETENQALLMELANKQQRINELNWSKRKKTGQKVVAFLTPIALWYLLYIVCKQNWESIGLQLYQFATGIMIIGLTAGALSWFSSIKDN